MVVIEAGVFLDFCGQLHAGHAGHVLIQQHHVEVVTQVRLGPQQGQGFLTRRHGADVQAPGAALLHQHLAAGFVVIHDQDPCAAQWPIKVGRGVLEALRIQRQSQPERTAMLALLQITALDPELTLHQQHQLARDDQTEMAVQAIAGQQVLTV